jgi:Undecaprenyl-phosphate glucose phosphotransferase
MPARSETATLPALPKVQSPARTPTPTASLTSRKIGFAAIAAGVDICGIAIAAIAAYAFAPFEPGEAIDLADRIAIFASIMATLFICITLIQCEYVPPIYLGYSAQVGRTITTFAVAFFFTAAIGYVTGETAELLCARSGALLGCGLPAVLVGRLILARRVRVSVARSGLAPRRIMLLGTEEEIEGFYQRCLPEEDGLRVMNAAVLRERNTLEHDLALAASMARVMRADDVFILVPWSDTETVERCLDAFLCVPAAVHLDPGPLFDRFARARIDRIGSIASLALDHSSLSGPNVVLKRAFDIVVSFTALVALAPLLVPLAIAIELDSKGPALFRQRRYGFNQEPFQIFKLRTMNVLEDGENVTQACAGDPRITRIGRTLRRTNLDELPQLVNVLVGDMSLVGPRPHALAHDQAFRPSVTLYGRRHNVKPGITGWAQVNGLRGEVTPATLKARIEHDLYYIDNWSFWLDLWILWRTVTSRKAFLNAN